jgi:hypothetical protein
MKSSSGHNVADKIDMKKLIAAMEARLGNVILQDDSPFFLAPQPGYKRGIEFLTASNLARSMLNVFLSYGNAHGVYPDLTDPKTFTEKMVWTKFFAPMKTPESGNKLLTSYFIPEEAKDLVSCPEIVWHSPKPGIPADGDLEPGSYYLKTNFGCNMYQRLDYPLEPPIRAEVEATFAQHLEETFGLISGEWWYTAFRRQLMIERDVSGGADSIAYCYFVFRGEVALLSVYRKSNLDSTLLRPDFELFEYQIPGRSRTEFDLPSKKTREMMKRAAELIGGPLPFARIDFLMAPDEQFYLGEVTFTPGNALTRWPGHINRRLGDMWQLDR